MPAQHRQRAIGCRINVFGKSWKDRERSSVVMKKKKPGTDCAAPGRALVGRKE